MISHYKYAVYTLGKSDRHASIVNGDVHTAGGIVHRNRRPHAAVID